MKMKCKGILAAALSVSVLFSVPAAAESILAERDAAKPKASASAGAGEAAQTKLYRLGDFTYSVPKDWKQMEQNGLTAYAYKDSAYMMVAYDSVPGDLSYPLSDLENELLIRLMEATLESYGLKVESSENITVNSHAFIKISAAAQDFSGISAGMQAYILMEGYSVFAVAFAQTPKIDDGFQVCIDQIISSIQSVPAGA